MSLKWGSKEVNGKPRLSFFDYLVAFFSEGFGWLILFLLVLCGLVYLFSDKL